MIGVSLPFHSTLEQHTLHFPAASLPFDTQCILMSLSMNLTLKGAGIWSTRDFFLKLSLFWFLLPFLQFCLFLLFISLPVPRVSVRHETCGATHQRPCCEENESLFRFWEHSCVNRFDEWKAEWADDYHYVHGILNHSYDTRDPFHVRPAYSYPERVLLPLDSRWLGTNAQVAAGGHHTHTHNALFPLIPSMRTTQTWCHLLLPASHLSSLALIPLNPQIIPNNISSGRKKIHSFNSYYSNMTRKAHDPESVQWFVLFI